MALPLFSTAMRKQSQFLKQEYSRLNAGIAQLVEQLICNQQVIGSSPIAGSLNQEDLRKIDSFSAGATAIPSPLSFPREFL